MFVVGGVWEHWPGDGVGGGLGRRGRGRAEKEGGGLRWRKEG